MRCVCDDKPLAKLLLRRKLSTILISGRLLLLSYISGKVLFIEILLQCCSLP